MPFQSHPSTCPSALLSILQLPAKDIEALANQKQKHTAFGLCIHLTISPVYVLVRTANCTYIIDLVSDSI